VTWTAHILTIFPGMFPGPLGHSLAGRAMAEKIWDLKAVDIRDFAVDVHRTVDDSPFGGGPGMVMRADVLDAALESVADAPGPVIYLTPRGSAFDQERADPVRPYSPRNWKYCPRPPPCRNRRRTLR